MRNAARVVFLLGAVGVGLFLFRSTPREVVLVYALGDGPVDAVEVEIARGAEVVRSAELRPGAGAAGSLQHRVRLQDGDYTVRLRIARRGAAAIRVERSVTVTESGTIVLPLESAR